MRSLFERTTTRAGSSCEWGGCVGKRDAPYIFLIHITPPPQRCGSSLENPPYQRGKEGEAFRGLSCKGFGRPTGQTPWRLAPPLLLRGNIFIKRGTAGGMKTPLKIPSREGWLAQLDRVGPYPAPQPTSKPDGPRPSPEGNCSTSHP